MKTPASLKIVLLVAVLPLFGGCASAPPPVDVAPLVAPADGVYVGQPNQPPPPNQQDVIPIPSQPRTVVWFIPGHWEWRGKYVWVVGHWARRPHPGDIWLPGKWVQQGNVYVWQGGNWRSGAPADEESTDVH